MCSKCFSCMLSHVHYQCGNFTGSLGEADSNFEASTARLDGPCFLQADSFSSKPGSLRTLQKRQVQPSAAARALQTKGKLEALQSPGGRDAVFNAGSRPTSTASPAHLVLFFSPCAMAVICSDAISAFLLQSAEPHKLFKQCYQELPLASTCILACTPITQGRLCQFSSLQCWKMLLNNTNKHGVLLPQGSPRKEENEGEKHFPAQRKDASSERDAPHAAWQRLDAPGKPIFKQVAFACQFTSPVDLQVCPQSSQLSSPVPEAAQLAGDTSSSTEPCQHIEQAAMPLLSTPTQARQPRPCQPMGAGPIYATPKQVGAGDPPTGPKDAARSWQHTGAILGRGAAICQDRRQRSLHVNKAPKSSHQLCSALS